MDYEINSSTLAIIPLDENTSKVLISTDFVQQYYETNNIVLKPNSTFEYVVSYDRGNDEYGNSLLKEYKLNLEVIGIFKHLNVENDLLNEAIVATSGNKK